MTTNLGINMTTNVGIGSNGPRTHWTRSHWARAPWARVIWARPKTTNAGPIFSAVLFIRPPSRRPSARWQFYPDIGEFRKILQQIGKYVWPCLAFFCICFGIFDPGICIFISKRSDLLQQEMQETCLWTPNFDFHVYQNNLGNHVSQSQCP